MISDMEHGPCACTGQQTAILQFSTTFSPPQHLPLLSCISHRPLPACRLQPAVTVTQEDEEALTTIRGIFAILEGGPFQINSMMNGGAWSVWTELYPLLPELLPGVLHTGGAGKARALRLGTHRNSCTSSVG